MIYELKITLRLLGQSVFRKIHVDGRITFDDLHRILQIAFNWDDYHLHEFFVTKTNGTKVENVSITSNSEKDDNFFIMLDEYDEKKEKIADWFKIAKDSVIYTYDFGDDWRHEITLVKKMKPEKGVKYPRCVDAKYLAPEEDSGALFWMGEAELEDIDREYLIREINEELVDQLPHLITEGTNKDEDYWEEVLLKAKEFHKLKPWNYMSDESIFAVVDPVTKEYLFCSVMGAAGEMFGLVVYVGTDGYQALINTLGREEPSFDILINQRSIVLSFEDRENLEKEEYTLIKTYDVPFRGRNAWPSFRSYKPGYYPWMMDDEEARIMLVALGQSIEVCKEINNGLEIPDLLFDEEVYAKVPEENGFESKIISLVNYPEDNEPAVPLAISELDFKRMKTSMSSIDTPVEFLMEYIDMPIQNESGKRPIFPVLVLAVDHREGIVIYQDLLQEKSDIGILQSELLKVFQAVNGIPEKIMMHQQTAKVMEPLIDKLKLNVQTEDYFSIGHMVIDELQNNIPRF